MDSQTWIVYCAGQITQNVVKPIRLPNVSSVWWHLNVYMLDKISGCLVHTGVRDTRRVSEIDLSSLVMWHLFGDVTMASDVTINRPN